MRRAAVLALFGSLTMLTLLLLAGHGPWAGHTIWHVTDLHGLNSGDLLPLGLWVAGTFCCIALWRR